VVVCLKLGADLHTAQLMPLPLTVSCFSKIQIGFTFLVLADLGSPGKRAVKRVCVLCVCVFLPHGVYATVLLSPLWTLPAYSSYSGVRRSIAAATCSWFAAAGAWAADVDR